jgi:hypothetical protein
MVPGGCCCTGMRWRDERAVWRLQRCCRERRREEAEAEAEAKPLVVVRLRGDDAGPTWRQTQTPPREAMVVLVAVVVMEEGPGAASPRREVLARCCLRVAHWCRRGD